jgi:N-acyl-D-aspartate/D-glutamate deacylase
MAPEALAAGVRWEFESFPEYLDCLDRAPTAINVASFIGHTPVRIEVMGADASERAATPDELDAMCQIVADARHAGAWGMATSFGTNHVGPGGRHVPSFVGGIDEVVVLAQAMGSGVVEVAKGRLPISDMHRLNLPGLTVSWTSILAGRPGFSTDVTSQLEASVDAQGQVWPQMSCRPIIVRVLPAKPVGLATLACFRSILAAPAEERAALYADPGWRKEAADEMGSGWDPLWNASCALKDGVEDPRLGVQVGAVARRRGVAPFEAFVDLALELGLDTRFDVPAANLDEVEVARLLNDPRTVIGLSDAGAHTNQQCDASFATYLLGHWVRERQALSLEQAIWRLTGQPAAVYGFADRGVIRPGAVADLVALDPDAVAAGPLERVVDLPGGASRLTSRSDGIAHVWVGGTEIVRDGACVGDLPGRLLRRPVPAA